MVRVADCHAGVLGSNPGGPKRFSPRNYFTGGSLGAVAGYTQLWLMPGSQDIKLDIAIPNSLAVGLIL